tara:strand:- start:3018 stop:4103 length:1086 start_codon:yes stop_codon:yes gene_type:complete
MIKIPIYKPLIGKEEKLLVNDCIKTSWISSSGIYVKRFEDKIKEYVGCRYAISSSNGTTALHLAMLALKIGKNDEVITSNYTYVASTNAILIAGARPVFVDIDPNTFNIDVKKIENKITPKTKAILVTNVYGSVADFVSLRKLADKYSLKIIEDAAESLGSKLDGIMSGNLADISTFSFYGNKTITTGEGGMVTTNIKEYAEIIKKLKNQGNSETNTYFHDILGFNYRMTNIQAAIGVAQMNKIELILEKKKRVYLFYYKHLNKIVSFPKLLKSSVSSHWMCPILFNNENQQKKAVMSLTKNAIETRPFFTPIDLLPFYETDLECRSAKDIYKRGLLLPSFPTLKQKELKRIVEIIKYSLR